MVWLFHHKFGQPAFGSPNPHIPDDEVVRFRLWLVTEEFFELLESAVPSVDWKNWEKQVMQRVREEPIKVNMVGFIDATIDLDYAVEGTRITFGVDSDPLWRLVHKANMNKEGIRTGGDLKIAKGDNWIAPDIEGELIHQGWKP